MSSTDTQLTPDQVKKIELNRLKGSEPLFYPLLYKLSIFSKAETETESSDGIVVVHIPSFRHDKR